ncbi:CHRD domain-containing protein [Robertkochia flava]|uniref:CHRD domain-containing protein n=1 Tax=Robertkochia flava TaxID=3447986 RepID=UPI001CCC2898|nr:CHRD domain-containing protein [Robertkochia marina]
MRTCRKYYGLTLLLFVFLLPGCSSDDDGNDNNNGEITEVDATTYDLAEVNGSGVFGTARIADMSDGSVTISLDLEGTPSGGEHPAHIHFNTAAEGGGIALTLGTVDGSSGESTINVTEFDDGSAVTYQDLLDYNGYINVHLSANELETIVAQGDIGQNDLTGTVKTYPLSEQAVAGISGTIEFAERENGTALATIALTGTPEGGSHPAHIHENDVATGGGIIFTFNPVSGDTGISRTQVAEFDNGDPLTYADILEVNGYVNVHLSAEDLGTLVAQGNIGSNEGN